MRSWLFAIALVLLVAPLESFAQVGAKKQGDPRVKELLDKAELKYEVDSDGDFKLLNSFDNGRSQVVFILTETVQLGDLEIREVFSIGYVSADSVSAEIARNLLEENRRVKLGAWELNSLGGKEVGVFRAKIAAETDVNALLMTLHAVTSTADQKEQELLSSDEL